MVFPTRPSPDYERVGAGERHGTNVVILSHARWADGLVVGRFAHVDTATGELQNLAGVESPIIAGVVLREVSNPVDAYDENSRVVYRWPDRGRQAVDASCDGLVTVRVLPGDNPARFGAVYAVNAEGDTAGMATTDDEGVETGAIFIREEKPGVWLIRDHRLPQAATPPEPVVYTISPATASGAVGGTVTFALLADGEPVTGPLQWRAPVESGITATSNGDMVIVDAEPGEYEITVDGFPGVSATLTVTE